MQTEWLGLLHVRLILKMMVAVREKVGRVKNPANKGDVMKHDFT